MLPRLKTARSLIGLSPEPREARSDRRSVGIADAHARLEISTILREQPATMPSADMRALATNAHRARQSPFDLCAQPDPAHVLGARLWSRGRFPRAATVLEESAGNILSIFVSRSNTTTGCAARIRFWRLNQTSTAVGLASVFRNRTVASGLIKAI